MNVFAHRGYRALYPENTLLAFEKALETPCYGIELDVQMTCDGKLVIIHDEKVDRTTNGTGLISEKTFAEVRQLNAGQGQTIPTLDEYFALVQNAPIVTNIELKNNIVEYPHLEEKVLEAITANGLADKVLVSSFNHSAVLRMKALAPNMPCAFLCGASFNLDEIEQKMKQSGVEYFNPPLAVLNEDMLQDLQRRGLRCNVWTVNEPADILRMKEGGMAGIFSDDPVKALQALQ